MQDTEEDYSGELWPLWIHWPPGKMSSYANFPVAADHRLYALLLKNKNASAQYVLLVGTSAATLTTCVWVSYQRQAGSAGFSGTWLVTVAMSFNRVKGHLFSDRKGGVFQTTAACFNSAPFSEAGVHPKHRFDCACPVQRLQKGVVSLSKFVSDHLVTGLVTKKKKMLILYYCLTVRRPS